MDGSSLIRAAQTSFLATLGAGCTGRSDVEVQRRFLMVGVNADAGVSAGVVSKDLSLIIA